MDVGKRACKGEGGSSFSIVRVRLLICVEAGGVLWNFGSLSVFDLFFIQGV